MKQLVLKRITRIHLIWLIIFVLVSAARGSIERNELAASHDVSRNQIKGFAQESVRIQSAKPPDMRELKLGEPVDRELSGGEEHPYRLLFAAGEYVKILVTQNGIDVAVRVFGSDGTKVFEVNNGSAIGLETVFLVADAAGEHRLEIYSSEKGALPGRYKIEIQEKRAATDKDRVRVAAEQLFYEGSQLRDQRTAESFRKAVIKFQEALPMWRNVGEQSWEAHTLFQIGVAQEQLSEHDSALDHYQRAILLWRALGDRPNEASALTGIGYIYWRLGNQKKALEYYDQAMPIARATGDRQSQVEILNNTGIAHYSLGQIPEALKYYDEALALSRASGDRRMLPFMLNNAGGAYAELGEFQKALQYQDESLRLRREMGDRQREATALHTLGGTYLRMGDLEKALEYFQQALELKRAVGDRFNEAVTLQSIGIVHRRLGDFHKALEYQMQALTAARAVKNRRTELYVLVTIGAIKRDLKEPGEALKQFELALLLSRELGDRRAEIETLNHMGQVYLTQGNAQEAIEVHQRALQLSISIGSPVNEALSRFNQARAKSAQGDLANASAEMQTTLSIFESIRARIAGQALRSSFLASYRDFYEFDIDLLMRRHEKEPSVGFERAALQASERARARSLLDMLTESRADIRQGVDPVLLQRERSTQQTISIESERLTRLLMDKHTAEQEATARKQVEALLEEYEDIQSQIRVTSPRYAALTQPQPLSAKEIQQLLDKDTVLLEYALGQERSFLWVVTPTSIQSLQLPKRESIETQARRFYELVTTRKNRDREAQLETAAALSRMLLGPVAEQLGRKRLIIVPDGALNYVPFAALPDPGAPDAARVLRRRTKIEYEPLVIKHEIVSLPSASALAVGRQSRLGRLSAAKTVAVFADPVFGADDPRIKAVDKTEQTLKSSMIGLDKKEVIKSDEERSASESGLQSFKRLPHTREEAQAIVAQVRSRDSLLALDFSANHATALSEQLGQYRIVHFATHGLLNSVHPELSGIVLSLVDSDGRPQNGFLRLHEVYNLKLPAELVVLSGCNSALGKEVKGEGLVGLTRGFMYAGAARVMVSLWSVSDEGTAELMKTFYQGMLTKRLQPAAALRAAQIAMWKNKWWDAPYYWSGFVLQGEW